jgi:Fur family transcriptional regulator, ferric uptake regulator
MASSGIQDSLRERGVRLTRQRRLLLDLIDNSGLHLDAERLYQMAKEKDPKLNRVTVYRTLKLLKECGLAAERHFDDGQARYEPTEETAQHHDHIICERCGKIVEFNSEELERQQERIARFLGFVVSRHRMELYGICSDCREGKRGTPAKPRGIQQL